MRFTKMATAGFGLAAAAAMTFSGSGGASAAALLPSYFPHTQSLSDGTVTVKVTNGTSKTTKCQLSVHDASKKSQLEGRAAAVNVLLGFGLESDTLAEARQDAAAGALKIVWTNKSILKDGTATATWKSGRTDTSYAIYQECTSPDPLLGLTYNGVAQVYLVNGTGKSPDSPDDSGNGSLGGLFGGLLG
ncbi:hypothetical protein RVF83_08200 [Gordonia rubripertincta]|uniref:Uncharacterized protein n=2 Tax=Gordonia rubripertincta TaxID=36822 RepID=A0AAW6R572_GORRU|nr:hypothetical protein [Gordonia rubripertincta]MDG6780953.1 hypothetical protein [Gordonia rubripertincta]NKY66043.1 hypothetical protein [Gordonia rubripertincta]GAB85625.1 hypothetical protein GORBP_064_00100 [Gordonia rubripertincta NBRC 101908]